MTQSKYKSKMFPLKSIGFTNLFAFDHTVAIPIVTEKFRLSGSEIHSFYFIKMKASFH